MAGGVSRRHVVIRIYANIRSGVLLKATVVVVDDEGMYLLQDVKMYRPIYLFNNVIICFN